MQSKSEMIDSNMKHILAFTYCFGGNHTQIQKVFSPLGNPTFSFQQSYHGNNIHYHPQWPVKTKKKTKVKLHANIEQ